MIGELPDMIAYFQSFNINYLPAQQASKLYRYEPKVFVFPAWREIYTPDEERKISFEQARDFGMNVQKIYPSCLCADNRKTQAEFVCVSCGYTNHADVVGAINILERGRRLLACGEEMQSGRSGKQEPTQASYPKVA